MLRDYSHSSAPAWNVLPVTGHICPHLQGSWSCVCHSSRVSYSGSHHNVGQLAYPLSTGALHQSRTSSFLPKGSERPNLPCLLCGARPCTWEEVTEEETPTGGPAEGSCWLAVSLPTVAGAHCLSQTQWVVHTVEAGQACRSWAMKSCQSCWAVHGGRGLPTPVVLFRCQCPDVSSRPAQLCEYLLGWRPWGLQGGLRLQDSDKGRGPAWGVMAVESGSRCSLACGSTAPVSPGFTQPSCLLCVSSLCLLPRSPTFGFRAYQLTQGDMLIWRAFITSVRAFSANKVTVTVLGRRTWACLFQTTI